MTKKQHKRKPSADRAKHLLQTLGENKAISECRKEINSVKSIIDEVYWKAVMYHIKQLIKNKPNDSISNKNTHT